MNRFIVVGAGVAGLTASHTLSGAGEVLIVDRLPACGGILPYDHPVIREFVRNASRRGVKFALGATATRWTGDRLLVASPQNIRWEPATHLVYAGGSRPSTAAELRLSGSTRLAGILAAPVAVHLLEAGVRIGTRVVVIGSGDWAGRTISELAHHDICVIGVDLPDEAGSGYRCCRVEHYADWTPTVVYGQGRVGEVLVERAGTTQRILCDALVLAARQRPLRNVDGAIEDSPTTRFVQHIAEHTTIEEVSTHAQEASLDLIHQLGAG